LSRDDSDGVCEFGFAFRTDDRLPVEVVELRAAGAASALGARGRDRFAHGFASFPGHMPVKTRQTMNRANVASNSVRKTDPEIVAYFDQATKKISRIDSAR